MEVVWGILVAILSTGVVMVAYRKLAEWLRTRDDDNEGVDDIVAKLMDMGEGVAQQGVAKLIQVLAEKQREAEAEKEEE